MTIEPARIRVLNEAEPNAAGRYVLYFLQQANRSRFNPALELAIEEANRLGLPVVACFGLLDGSNGFPEANARHYAFLLEGLADAARGLAERGIGFVLRKASPAEIALDLSREAALLVLDRGYLAIQKRWYGEIVAAVETRIVQVEGDVVVPVEVVSGKHEYAARTLRPKLHKHLDDYVAPLAARKVKHRAGAGAASNKARATTAPERRDVLTRSVRFTDALHPLVALERRDRRGAGGGQVLHVGPETRFDFGAARRMVAAEFEIVPGTGPLQGFAQAVGIGLRRRDGRDDEAEGEKCRGQA